MGILEIERKYTPFSSSYWHLNWIVFVSIRWCMKKHLKHRQLNTWHFKWFYNNRHFLGKSWHILLLKLQIKKCMSGPWERIIDCFYSFICDYFILYSKYDLLIKIASNFYFGLNANNLDKFFFILKIFIWSACGHIKNSKTLRPRDYWL